MIIIKTKKLVQFWTAANSLSPLAIKLFYLHQIIMHYVSNKHTQRDTSIIVDRWNTDSVQISHQIGPIYFTRVFALT